MFAAKALAARINSFLYGCEARSFLGVFAGIFYPYCLIRLWLVDFQVYAAMAPWNYHPIGLPALLGLPFPSLDVVNALRTLATVAGVCACLGFRFRTAAGIFFVSKLLLDAWTNMFGFVNVEIHATWFAGFLILASLNAADRKGPSTGGDSLAFRCMELVMVLAYVQAFASKMLTAGFAWAAAGTTLQIGLLRQGMPVGEALAAHSVLMPILSWATLAFEFSFALYFLIPPRWRLALLLAAVGFHLGTWITMGIDFSHLWIFGATVLLAGPYGKMIPRRLFAHKGVRHEFRVPA